MRAFKQIWLISLASTIYVDGGICNSNSQVKQQSLLIALTTSQFCRMVAGLQQQRTMMLLLYSIDYLRSKVLMLTEMWFAERCSNKINFQISSTRLMRVLYALLMTIQLLVHRTNLFPATINLAHISLIEIQHSLTKNPIVSSDIALQTFTMTSQERSSDEESNVSPSNVTPRLPNPPRMYQ